MTTATETPTMTGKEIIDLTKKHTLYEWSAQSKVDPIPVARAKGIYFWTPEGKRFIDFNSQLMSVNIGHGDERVIQAIADQAATLCYANPFMATEVRARLGQKLAEITPGDIDTFFFTNGGAEANENAIKLARFFTGRHKIIARYRSYHGATAGAISRMSRGSNGRGMMYSGPNCSRLPPPAAFTSSGTSSRASCASASAAAIFMASLMVLARTSSAPRKI